MGRTIGAVLAGIFAGFGAVIGFEALGPRLVPELSTLSPEELADGAALLANYPQLGAVVLSGFAAGALLCILVAGLIADPANRGRVALGLGLLHFTLDISNFLIIEHPLWMMLATLPMAPIGAIVGYLLANALRPAPANHAE